MPEISNFSKKIENNEKSTNPAMVSSGNVYLPEFKYLFDYLDRVIDQFYPGDKKLQINYRSQNNKIENFFMLFLDN